MTYDCTCGECVRNRVGNGYYASLKDCLAHCGNRPAPDDSDAVACHSSTEPINDPTPSATIDPLSQGHPMRLVSALLLLLSIAALTASAQQTTAPIADVTPKGSDWVEVKGLPGRLLILQTTSTAKWLPIDDGFDLVPSSDGKSAAFVAPTAGRYRLTVVVNGEPGRVAVTVGTPAPPVPPTPPDPVAAAIAAAYSAEPAPDKRDRVKDLAALYRQAAVLAADPTVTSSGALLARVQAAAKTLVGPDAVKGVRAVAAGELGRVLPVDGPLSDGQRGSVVATFKKLATILEGLP